MSQRNSTTVFIQNYTSLLSILVSGILTMVYAQVLLLLLTGFAYLINGFSRKPIHVSSTKKIISLRYCNGNTYSSLPSFSYSFDLLFYRDASFFISQLDTEVEVARWALGVSTASVLVSGIAAWAMIATGTSLMEQMMRERREEQAERREEQAVRLRREDRLFSLSAAFIILVVYYLKN